MSLFALLVACATPSPLPTQVPDGACGVELLDQQELLDRVGASLRSEGPWGERAAARLVPAAPGACSPSGTRCLERRRAALESLWAALEAEHPSEEQRRWTVGAKVDWVTETGSCEAAKEDEDLSENPALVVSRGGTVNGGSMTLDTGGAEFVSTPLTLTAALICERNTPEGFVAVDPCHEAELTQGDRFKVSFTTSAAAHVYFYLFNGRNQFQMFFPPPGISNRTVAGREYFLPAGEGWIVLDAVGGVLERVQIAASIHPINELESLRGLNLPAGPDGELQRQAVRTRGRLEPVIERGGVPTGSMQLQDGEQLRTGSGTRVESHDVAATEFRFHHR